MQEPTVKCLSCEECILDGEMLLWDDRHKRFNEFGYLSTFIEFKKKSLEEQSKSTDKQIQRNGVLTSDMSEMWPCYVIFDILYLKHGKEKCTVDGNVMNESLAVRKGILDNIIDPVPNVFQTLPYKKLMVNQSNLWQNIVQDCMTEVCLKKKEGLVLKNFGSPYVLGETSRKSKYKRS